MATAATIERAYAEPLRTLCSDCASPVLIVVVPAIIGSPEQIVLAEPYEWQPRSRCSVCANNAARAGRRCTDCKGSGYVGGAQFLRVGAAELGGESAPCPTCDGLGTLGAPKRDGCSRCGGDGYVGTARPQGVMLGIDIAWDDDGHIRLVGPKTDRRMGEALHSLHRCGLAPV